MLSLTVEYALRAIVAIGQYNGAPCTAQKIAEMTQVPAPYLSKLMQGMARAGLVTSKRGLHGGFVLTKDPNELTVLEVTNAVDPIKRIRECPLGIRSHGGGLCPLHKRLDNAMALVEESFGSTTVAQLLAEPGSATPLCEDRTFVQINLGDSLTSIPKSASTKESTTKKSTTKKSTTKKNTTSKSKKPTSKVKKQSSKSKKAPKAKNLQNNPKLN